MFLGGDRGFNFSDLFSEFMGESGLPSFRSIRISGEARLRGPSEIRIAITRELTN